MYFLPFTFLVPLLSCIILYVFNNKLSNQQVKALGVGSVLVSALSALIASVSYFSTYAFGTVVGVVLWQWTSDVSLSGSFGLALDGLSIMLMALISVVGLLIHLYMIWYMQSGDRLARVCSSRFFSYSNLLFSAMLLVVLADNLLVVYVAWELMALACYMFFKDFTNVSNSRSLIPAVSSSKVTIVSRISSVFLALAFLLLAKEMSTLSIVEVVHKAPLQFANNAPVLVLITSMLAIAVIGKSAQLPLHTWLLELTGSVGLSSPVSSVNSSEGYAYADSFAPQLSNIPTTSNTSKPFKLSKLPSSFASSRLMQEKNPAVPFLAMIQSLAVATVGVYLVARFHPLFELTPAILTWWIGFIGAVTVVVGAVCASVQTNIQRVLAYSTMSQVGFMFLALGVSAWQLAIFHLLAHGVIKSLLILASGVVVDVSNQETELKKMGGLSHSHPLLLLSFIVATGALVGLPFITVGYFSLSGILLQAYLAKHQLLFTLAMAGVFLTAFYSCRLIWYVFFNDTEVNRAEVNEANGTTTINNNRNDALAGSHQQVNSGNAKLGYKIPLILLMLLSTTLGLVFSPAVTGVLTDVLPVSEVSAVISHDSASKGYIGFLMGAVTVAGMAVAWLLYVMNKSKPINSFARSTVGGMLVYWCYHGLGFDDLYTVFYRYLRRFVLWEDKADSRKLVSKASELSKASSYNNHYILRFTLVLATALSVLFVLLFILVL